MSPSGGCDEDDAMTERASDGTQPLPTVMARLGRELEALHALSETAQVAVATLTGQIVLDP